MWLSFLLNSRYLEVSHPHPLPTRVNVLRSLHLPDNLHRWASKDACLWPLMERGKAGQRLGPGHTAYHVLQWTFLNNPPFSVFLAIFHVLKCVFLILCDFQFSRHITRPSILFSLQTGWSTRAPISRITRQVWRGVFTQGFWSESHIITVHSPPQMIFLSTCTSHVFPDHSF